jgi:hypothetical protein
MPEKVTTQEKFSGASDLILGLTVEEAQGWRRMPPAMRQRMTTEFGRKLVGGQDPLARIEDAVQPIGRNEASQAAIARAEDFGVTDEEGQEDLAMSGNSYRPARVALVKLGMVAPSGDFRDTRAGNKANAWVSLVNPVNLDENFLPNNVGDAE